MSNAIIIVATILKYQLTPQHSPEWICSKISTCGIFIPHKFTKTPATTPQKAITMTEIMVALLPTSERIAAIDTVLVAGPTTKKIKTAPGENPFNNNAIATGTDALEQT